MSLRLHLIQTIALVLLATLLLGGMLIYWHAVRKIETEMQAAMAVATRLASNSVKDSQQTPETAKRVNYLIEDFDGDRHVRAFVVNVNENIIKSSRWSAPENPAPEWLLDWLAGPPRVFTVPLPADFHRYGRVILQADPRNETAEAWADAKLYFLILISFCGVVLFCLYFALGRALRPLGELLTGFSEIGKGDYRARLETPQTKELAVLTSGFNDMAGHLEEMQNRNSRLREQLEAVQEEERAELARNLHDEFGPLLFSVDVDATTIAGEAKNGDLPTIKERATDIKSAVALMKRNVKTILGQLRPAGLHALSLKSTIEDLVAFWETRHPKITFNLQVPERSWGVRIDSAVQSIVRESLANAIKHTNPSKIELKIEEQTGSILAVEIIDNGGGLTEPKHTDGLGLIGMRERAALLGGTLTVENRSNPSGVAIFARIPLSVGEDAPLNESQRKAAVA